ncbi:MAG: acyl-CoA reductase [Flavobacteriaceae bacterium]
MKNSAKSKDKIHLLIEAFDHLGDQLRNHVNSKATRALSEAVEAARIQNAWFTTSNIHTAFRNWGDILRHKTISNWLSTYPTAKWSNQTVGLVLAGNLPLVGFHDVVCVLLSGHRAVIKLSSKDKVLIPAFISILESKFPEINDRVQFVSDQLGSVDKVIATGSNNSSRYFSYYFKDIPHIIRRNRNSVAVLTGYESDEQLAGLADDICLYFGLGCRSVSKIWVPKDYDFDILFGALYKHKDIIHHNGYANNYDYNKAIFLINQEPLLDNGFLILKEDDRISSPIACLYYRYYDDRIEVEQTIAANREDIQCVVSSSDENSQVLFGEAQYPQLHDYADNIDTMDLLLKN